MIRSLYDLGLFSCKKIKIGKNEIAPRALTSKLFVEKFTSDSPDVCIMRVEAHHNRRVASYSLVDYYDPATKMTAMMRTTAWPASIVVMMMASGEITKRGGVRQETDVPAQKFLQEMAKRGIRIEHKVD
jgi:lysine 6-dehydrogenase